jgi:hypothetical protein
MNTLTIKNGDLRFSARGELALTSGPAKVVQDVTHWLLNDLGYNHYHPWMGASLDDFIGQPTHPGVASKIKDRIRESLNLYSDMVAADLKERIDETGDSFLAIGKSDPSSIVKDWTRLEVTPRAGDILVHIGFTTWTNESDYITLFLSMMDEVVKELLKDPQAFQPLAENPPA